MRSWMIMAAAIISAAALKAGGLEVRPNPALIAPGATVVFSATADGLPIAAEWQVVPNSLGTIDSRGNFVASGKPGQGLVRAIAQVQGQRSIGHAMVRVLSSDDRRLAVFVSPNYVKLKAGEQSLFTARIEEAGGSQPTISWRVVPPDLGEIDENGLFTAHRAGRGRVVALARSSAGRGLGQARVLVAPADRRDKLVVNLSPKIIRLGPEASAQISVEVRDSLGKSVDAVLRYRVSPPSLGSVSSDGIFTASSNPGRGTLIVTADHDGMSGQARGLVVVSGQAKRYRVQLRPKTVALAPYSTTEFQPLCLDDQGNLVEPPYWIWRVIPQDLGTITPEGLFTAGDRTRQGKVVASLPPDFGQGQDFASVRIKPGPPRIIRVSPAKAMIRPGQTQQFIATAQGLNEKNLENPRFIWKVTPEGLGTITQDGLFTAGPEPKLGAVLALLPPEQGGGRGYAVVGVSNYNVLILGPRPCHLSSGEAHQFQAELRDQNGSIVAGAVFEWSANSIYPNFGDIDPATGIFTAGMPAAQQAEGTVYVRAKLNGRQVGGDGIKVIVHRP